MVNVISQIPAVNFCAGQTVANLPLFRRVGMLSQDFEPEQRHKTPVHD